VNPAAARRPAAGARAASARRRPSDARRTRRKVNKALPAPHSAFGSLPGFDGLPMPPELGSLRPGTGLLYDRRKGDLRKIRIDLTPEELALFDTRPPSKRKPPQTRAGGQP
jgi:hypothetical protein